MKISHILILLGAIVFLGGAGFVFSQYWESRDWPEVSVTLQVRNCHSHTTKGKNPTISTDCDFIYNYYYDGVAYQQIKRKYERSEDSFIENFIKNNFGKKWVVNPQNPSKLVHLGNDLFIFSLFLLFGLVCLGFYMGLNRRWAAIFVKIASIKKVRK